ncbi:hypothetical protein [Cesiribacter andamanensis]|uniref:Uncharacterized protein n=1 Tax=Cesiribacter andamanensis AMV16 TaxID=1279009 RepID=M7NGU1_9BACT|nr:hypothetical protein [Cesiribacter andamanensis]EMR01050.1 hypothetical protein ADICEAN_03821 [Cesiribacter andamanensis AMV16]
MSSDKDINRNKDNASYPADRQRADINPHTRTKEEAGNPDSDSDRKGRNIDLDLENQGNEIKGRSQQTSPRNRAGELGRQGEQK